MSNIISLIDTDLVEAIKARDLEKATILRTVKAQLQNATIQAKGELSNEQVIDVLQKEAKKRREAIDIYGQSNRQDLKTKEENELKLLGTYLPAPMTDEEVAQIIEIAIKETGASSIADMGKVMGKINAQTKGRADGSKIASLVKDKLNS
jgi:hypothetical protein